MPPSPLVSVLIRTTGRATLPRAIATAQAQTHRPLEIVVVNAGTTPLPALPAAPGVEVRVVGAGPLRRPQAANAALDNARGQWLVFLDDDDEFMDKHVETLLAAAARSAGARVAYSATACVEPDGSIRRMIGGEFDRRFLFTGNFVTNSALLFHASLPGEGARFDETLDCFEDWDFAIQLAQRTHFAFTRLVTNRWHAHAGESGAGLGANKREEATQPYKDGILRKWAAHAAALEARVKHHEAAARQFAARGESAYAQLHREEVARLMGGRADPDMVRGN